MRTSPRLTRWIVPAAAVTLVAGGIAASAQATGGADREPAPDLPERTPDELVAAVAAADVDALSGTVRTEADLGLPDLSMLAGTMGATATPSATASADGTDPQGILTRLLAGESTVQVATDRPDRFRAVLDDSAGGFEVVSDGQVAWAYSAAEGVATRFDLTGVDADEVEGGPSTAPTGPEAYTPDALAAQLLADAEENAEVTVGEAQVVAGRDAYTLVLTPDADESLVDSIQLAVDAETSLPLQVQVLAVDHDGVAFSTGFTEIDYATPDASVFAFTPPAGVRVEEAAPGEGPFGPDGGEGAAEDGAEGPDHEGFEGFEGFEGDGAEGAAPEVVGQGWGSILVLDAPEGGLAALGDDQAVEGGTPTGGPDLDALMDQFTEPVEGGRVIGSTLLNVMIADDGRVLVGAVTAEALAEAAAS